MSNFGQWVTVPGSMTSSGKPERRFKMKSGEYRLTEPGTNEAISHRLGSLHRGVYDFLAAHDGDPSTNPGDLSPRTPSGLTAEQQRALIEGTEGATARVARIKAESDALVDAARKDPSHQYHNLFQQAPVVLADDVDARDSEKRRMLQQYAPGADLWATDAGKEMIQAAKSNQYEGDAAGLPEFYANQRKVGTGAMPEIIDAMGYTGAMAEWAKANPALAMREYNKKFGNSYAGTGPSNEEIKAAMDAGNFFPAEGSPNPLGKTGEARESNTAQTEAIQPKTRQAINNESLNAIEALRSHNVPDLYGMDMFLKTANKLYGGY